MTKPLRITGHFNNVKSTALVHHIVLPGFLIMDKRFDFASGVGFRGDGLPDRDEVGAGCEYGSIVSRHDLDTNVSGFMSALISRFGYSSVKAYFGCNGLGVRICCGDSNCGD